MLETLKNLKEKTENLIKHTVAFHTATSSVVHTGHITIPARCVARSNFNILRYIFVLSTFQTQETFTTEGIKSPRDYVRERSPSSRAGNVYYRKYKNLKGVC